MLFVRTILTVVFPIIYTSLNRALHTHTTKPVLFVDTLLTVGFLIIYTTLNQAWPTHTQNQCHLFPHYSLWCSQSVWAGTSVWTSWPRRASEDELVLRREIPAPGLYPVLLSHWHWKTKKAVCIHYKVFFLNVLEGIRWQTSIGYKQWICKV